MSVEPRDDLMELLSEIESSTDLEACAIVTKEGLRIAHATGTNTDADIFSALTAVILSMGYKAINELGHGDFKVVIIRGTEGYTIVTSIDNSGKGLMREFLKRSNFLFLLGHTNMCFIDEERLRHSSIIELFPAIGSRREPYLGIEYQGVRILYYSPGISWNTVAPAIGPPNMEAI